LESYLAAIDQLRNNIRFFNGNKGFKSSDAVLNNANTLLAKAISKLEDEFKQLLISYRCVIAWEMLFMSHMQAATSDLYAIMKLQILFCYLIIICISEYYAS